MCIVQLPAKTFLQVALSQTIQDEGVFEAASSTTGNARSRRGSGAVREVPCCNKPVPEACKEGSGALWAAREPDAAHLTCGPRA